jgi:hypothetical protein
MGWTWDYVEWNVDLPRLRSLHKYWRRNPPIHVLVAAYMKYEPKEEVRTEAAKVTEDMSKQMEMFMSMVPQAAVKKLG